MPEISLPAPELVTRPAQLRQVADRLLQEPIVAVDTESNSLYAYYERVCLVQFSIPEVDYLVDPLALTDLSPLGPLFADPRIEKIFHAAEYDVICMKRDYGFEFKRIFDTMAAARILGREAVGLGSLLEAEFGIHLDKRYQRANWGLRPLPHDLLSYARLDTHYLLPLRERLLEELRQQALWPLAKEDFERLRLANNHTIEEPEPLWQRVRGANDLTPQQIAVLNELCEYREQVAISLDRPVFKVINDDTLVEIARRLPQNLNELGHIHGMSPAQMRRHGRRLLEAMQRGLNNPPLYPPRQQRPSDPYLNRLDALRRWRKKTGEQMGVDSDIVLPRDLMLALAGQDPRTPEALGEVLADVPWRREKFGEQILELIKKTDGR